MTRGRIMIAVAGALGMAVLAAAGAWYFLIRNDSPPAVSLATAVTAVSSGLQPTSVSVVPASTSTTLSGTWSVVQSSNTFVGFRVNEQLVGFGAATAAGRTGDVSGSLVYDGSAITQVQVTANLASLASDKPQRDETLRTQALQTATFPKASFALTSSIPVPNDLTDGVTISQTASGQLTLHGVTKTVQIDLQCQLVGSQLVVVGALNIQFADYGIAQPRAAAVLSIEDHGVMELQLVFAQA